jgi:hypothetical protein
VPQEGSSRKQYTPNGKKEVLAGVLSDQLMPVHANAGFISNSFGPG